MQVSTQTDIGELSALPFLFSLMGFAGLFFLGSLFSVVADREEAERALSVANQQEQAAEKLHRESQAWRDRLASLQPKIAEGSLDKQAQATLVSLKQEWQRINSALEESQGKLGQLQGEKAKLEDKLAELQALEAKVARTRLSRMATETKIRQLKEQIESLKREIAGVQREVDVKERVQVKNLIPSGSRRPAVFVECDAQGVWMMPERKLLETSASDAAREAFLTRVRSKGYVVFLIRPDGFNAFRKFRELVETHNRASINKLEYGYEPINADWRLVYPTE